MAAMRSPVSVGSRVAVAPRDAAAVRYGVDGDDVGGAADPGGLDRAQADPAAAEHEHPLAGAQARGVEGAR